MVVMCCVLTHLESAAQKDLKNKRVWFAIRNLDSAATLHMTQI